MQTQTQQRLYNEVIAPHYDNDPQAVTRPSLDRALGQILASRVLEECEGPFDVLDVGCGTGLFLAKLLTHVRGHARPFGLDLSRGMVESARQKIPGLTAAIDDAANLDAHFPEQSFDLISTHFITGFVPMRVLAPKIHSRLVGGGYWSLVGGTTAAWPTLHARARSPVVRMLCGGKSFSVDELACNPTGRDEIVRTLEQNGFAVRAAETFSPTLRFRDFDEFLAFAYHGGWLTHFVEKLGLHDVGAAKKFLLNLSSFPVEDRHNIEIVLAQKVGAGPAKG